MPSNQASLDSFFGTKAKGPKQATLKKFFVKNKNTDKENNKSADDDDDQRDKKRLIEVDDIADDADDQQQEAPSATKRPSPTKNVTSTKRQRKSSHPHAIVDDSDEDGDDEEGNTNDTKPKPTELETTNTYVNGDQKDEKPTPMETESSSNDEVVKDEKNTSESCKDKKKDAVIHKKSGEKPKAKIFEYADETKSKNDDEDDKQPSLPTGTGPQYKVLAKQASKLAKELKLPSNEELLKNIKDAASKASTSSNDKKAKSPFAPIGSKVKDSSGGGGSDNVMGQPLLYSTLVQAFEKIESITGRLEIQGLMTDLFRRVIITNPKELYPVIYLASNSVAPAYKCVELGIGDSLLMKAISEAYGTKPAIVKEKLEEVGDLGTVAQTCKSKQRTLGFGVKPKPLVVANVLDVFLEIAETTGSKSQKSKIDKIKKLLVRAQDPAETKYIIRGLQGKLRIGLAESTVLISFAHALMLTIPTTVSHQNVPSSKEEANGDGSEVSPNQELCDKSLSPEKRLEAAVNIVKQAYNEVPSYDSLLDGCLAVPLTELSKVCHFQPGIPVTPMLAKPTKSIQEVLKRLNGVTFTCEYKYDGERAQVHQLSDGSVKVFSRNLLETTEKYPEVPLFVQEAATAASRAAASSKDKDETGDGTNSSLGFTEVTSFALDAEVVAYNPTTKQLVPFQVLSTRKKKEESAETAKVQVIVQAFDLMYLNGRSLLSVSLEERRRLMKQHFAPVEGKFQYATSLDFSAEEGEETTNLEQFLDAAVKGQCEGLMVKTLDDVYEPSRRSLNWLKLKKDYLQGLGDSVDLVPLGAYKGRGKRTGVYGAYLLACYDPDTEEFQSVCKIGTGFSDEDLQTLSKELDEHKINEKPGDYNVADGLECDVWFEAVQVWEVKAADLSQSSLHRGAIGKTGDSSRGIGLRFPRYERPRPDKKPEQATTSDQILEMYYAQDSVNTSGGGGDYADDDDDGI